MFMIICEFSLGGFQAIRLFLIHSEAPLQQGFLGQSGMGSKLRTPAS